MWETWPHGPAPLGLLGGHGWGQGEGAWCLWQTGRSRRTPYPVSISVLHVWQRFMHDMFSNSGRKRNKQGPGASSRRNQILYRQDLLSWGCLGMSSVSEALALRSRKLPAIFSATAFAELDAAWYGMRMPGKVTNMKLHAFLICQSCFLTHTRSLGTHSPSPERDSKWTVIP